MKPRPLRLRRRLETTKVVAKVTRLPVARPVFPDLLTPEEVADRLRCSRAHVYHLVQRGELGSVKIAKREMRVTTAQLAEFFARNTTEAAS